MKKTEKNWRFSNSISAWKILILLPLMIFFQLFWSLASKMSQYYFLCQIPHSLHVPVILCLVSWIKFLESEKFTMGSNNCVLGRYKVSKFNDHQRYTCTSKMWHISSREKIKLETEITGLNINDFIYLFVDFTFPSCLVQKSHTHSWFFFTK